MTDMTAHPTQQGVPLSAEKSRAGGLWLVQAASGLGLVLLLLLHMIAHHFVVEGGLRTYADVRAYVSNPLIFFLEITFLIVVTVHALLGLRAVIFDLSPGPRAKQVTNIVLTLLGVGVIMYGTWLALAIQQL